MLVLRFNGEKISEIDHPSFRNYGEQTRFTFRNDMMMEHSMNAHRSKMALVDSFSTVSPATGFNNRLHILAWTKENLYGS